MWIIITQLYKTYADKFGYRREGSYIYHVNKAKRRKTTNKGYKNVRFNIKRTKKIESFWMEA